MALLLCASQASAIESDQAAHFAVGYAISTTLSQVILSGEHTRKDKWAAFFVPFATAAFIGVMYEFGNPSGDSMDDIMWTGFGAALGSSFSVAIDF
jgi:drug/metabolite transporter (DMT)-like permease